MRLPGRRADPFADLALEHQRQALDPLELAEPLDQQRGRDVVGQVGDDADPAGAELGEGELAGVRLDQLEAPARGLGKLLERLDAARVALDRDHPRRAGREQGPGQAAGAGSDLDHGAPAQIAGRRRDPAEQLGIEQEMLAEPLVGAQPEALDDGPERCLGIHGAPARAPYIRTSTNACLRRSRR